MCISGGVVFIGNGFKEEREREKERMKKTNKGYSSKKKKETRVKWLSGTSKKRQVAGNRVGTQQKLYRERAGKALESRKNTHSQAS